MFTYIQERMSTFSFDISYSWPNCVSNKMFESLLFYSKNFRFDLSDYQELVIEQVKSDS